MCFDTTVNGRCAPIDKWDARGIELAKHIASWSKDPNKKVGAALVSADRRTIVPGYNGLPVGIEDTDARLNDQQYKLKHCVHAEANAILNATTRPAGYSLYIYPIPPCSFCAALIIQAGVARVISPRPPPDSSWLGSCTEGRSLLEEAGVECVWL